MKHMIWRPAFLLSRGQDHGSLSRSSGAPLPHRRCQSSDVRRGGRGGRKSERRDGGRQRRAGIIQRWTIPRGFSVFCSRARERHSCSRVCKLLADPCALYEKRCFHFSFHGNQAAVICAAAESSLRFHCTSRTNGLLLYSGTDSIGNLLKCG